MLPPIPGAGTPRGELKPSLHPACSPTVTWGGGRGSTDPRLGVSPSPSPQALPGPPRVLEPHCVPLAPRPSRLLPQAQSGPATPVLGCPHTGTARGCPTDRGGVGAWLGAHLILQPPVWPCWHAPGTGARGPPKASAGAMGHLPHPNTCAKGGLGPPIPRTGATGYPTCHCTQHWVPPSHCARGGTRPRSDVVPAAASPCVPPNAPLTSGARGPPPQSAPPWSSSRTSALRSTSWTWWGVGGGQREPNDTPRFPCPPPSSPQHGEAPGADVLAAVLDPRDQIGDEFVDGALVLNGA